MASRSKNAHLGFAFLLRQFYEDNSASDTRIKARRLVNNKQCLAQELDLDNQKASFIITDKNNTVEGQVDISQFLTKQIKIESSYPVTGNLFDVQAVAAMLILEQALEKWEKLQTGLKYNNSLTTTLEIDRITNLINYANTSAQNVNRAEIFIKYDEVEIVPSESEKLLTFKVFDSTKYAHVSFERTINQNILSTCSCAEITYKLCQHKVAALMHLKNKKGDYAFHMLKDHTAEKNNLLKEYGYSMHDGDFSDKFSFYLDEGELRMKVNDKNLKKITQRDSWEKITSIFSDRQWLNFNISNEQESIINNNVWGYGYALVFNENRFPAFEIIKLAGKKSDSGKRFKANICKPKDVPAQTNIASTDEMRKLDEEIKYINKDGLANHVNMVFRKKITSTRLSDVEQWGIHQYVWRKMKDLLPKLKKQIVGHLTDESLVKMANFIPLDIEEISPVLSFELNETEKFLELKAFFEWEEVIYPINEFKNLGYIFLQNERSLFLVDSVETAHLVQQFNQQPEIRIAKSDFLPFFQEVIVPLQSKFHLDIKADLSFIEEKIEPKNALRLTEIDNYLCVTPLVNYNGRYVRLYGNEDILYQNEADQLVKVIRNTENEADFKQIVEQIHPSFNDAPMDGSYYLPYLDVLKNNWFFSAFKRLETQDVELLGYEHLTRFKFNLNKPEILVMANSGIDWFDIEIKVKFGDTVLGLDAIKKAVKNNQQTIKLEDGTLGILPADFIEKHSTLLKIGEVDKGKLKISQLHFSLVEQLFEQYGSDVMFPDILDKKRKLLNYDEIKQHPVPQQVTAQLRDYQESGYNWLCFLDDFRWGGCIADDMGLGKTLQVLAFLQKKIAENPNKPHLVIVPTTLVFNWQNEINKFCPEIKYLIHRGTDRNKNTNVFKDYNIIITTYGILVRDIGMLSEFEFGYAVLDESQAIKNPNSKRYKASRLIKAQNRIVLTGTPVENNTFDLYAQMNFLNPGLLGSVPFFKEEFSNPIDRFGNEAKLEQLKKLVYPFLLRRTKKQVAAELPEKTENVMYCEMSTAQRSVYENYKKRYRQRILEKIEEDGLRKSSFFVLEGLLKLRQICDSPSLISEGVEFDHTPIKIEVLLNNLTEKIAEHKILVFSQFVGMLQLVKKQLDESGIIYEYLDGSTRNRKQRVDRFQNDPDCRVFLISLKAGGVGINLTEADYVFLLDPWWNPAVETQAIDRTHRIGQTKKVFSYKMICKDTIEEKVLKLQEKKKMLVSELISPENNFFKKLEKHDIVELFS